VIWRQKYWFAYSYLRWRRSHHPVFVQLQCLYGNWLVRYYARVTAYKFNRFGIVNWWWIRIHGGRKTGYTSVHLWHHRTSSNMTTSWSRSPLRHFRNSSGNINTLRKLSKCCGCGCSYLNIHLRMKNCRKLQFWYAMLLISFTDVVGCVPPSWLCQFVKLHLFLPKPHHALLYHSGDFTHHPAGFVDFTDLALLHLFIIRIFLILPLVGTCKIAHTVSDSHNHLLKHLFLLSGCHFRVFSCPCVFLLLPNRCLCIWISLSCPSSFSLNIILNPFVFLLSA